eukprot:5303430-Lingulodinium_polyedra.AAC.1
MCAPPLCAPFSEGLAPEGRLLGRAAAPRAVVAPQDVGVSQDAWRAQHDARALWVFWDARAER